LKQQSKLTDFGIINPSRIRLDLAVSWHPEGWAWDIVDIYSIANFHSCGSKASDSRFKAVLKDIIEKNPNTEFSIFVKPISERNCGEEVAQMICKLGGKVKRIYNPEL